VLSGRRDSECSIKLVGAGRHACHSSPAAKATRWVLVGLTKAIMSTAKSTFNPIPNLTFRLGSLSSSSKFSPRLGQLTLTRPVHDSLDGGGGIDIDIPTPGLMCTTTRGVIQHLSRDNVKRTSCVKWVHVPFESLCVELFYDGHAVLT
jgi:hypothetical protein